ncbi:hypothetical protein B0T19DRAFT_398681 [Cercophora scortea]|uniref:Gfd2/YDR514C-like C-terminal domain-containing protein n=1 Tax=Cercophora scortea TaxID=314031 RepID=A0AAE0IYP3_9PEZI|nr:hypothetical protein B0T19DRAFT_398681 [Cercophora scortea]
MDPSLLPPSSDPHTAPSGSPNRHQSCGTNTTSATAPFLQSLRGNALARLGTRLNNLEQLRTVVEESYCIGLDVEGVEGIAAGVTSVGLAILPPTPTAHFGIDQACHDAQGTRDLDRIVARYRIEAHCFAVDGRERSRSYEKFHYGSVIFVQASQIEETVVAVLESIQSRDPAATMVLIGFDMECEFRAISSTFPNINRFVMGWADIATMAGKLADARFSHLKASLRDTMLALSFLRNHGIQRRASDHSAGMDAVRTIGILVALLARQPSAGTLLIHRFTMEEHSNRIMWEKVPRPASKFPFTVKLCCVGGLPLPPTLDKPQRLFNFVTQNFGRPKAVAVCPGEKVGTAKTHGWWGIDLRQNWKPKRPQCKDHC